MGDAIQPAKLLQKHTALGWELVEQPNRPAGLIFMQQAFVPNHFGSISRCRALHAIGVDITVALLRDFLSLRDIHLFMLTDCIVKAV